MRWALPLAALAALAAGAGCRSCTAEAVVDAGPAGLVAKTVAVDPQVDASALVDSRVPSRTGSCAQVRSLQDEDEAGRVAEAIRTALALPVDVVRAELGDKGVWFRLCVGQEESEARLIARATQWTAPSGELEPYLDPPVEGVPAFHVLTRARVELRKATAAQARALLGFALVAPGPDSVRFFGGPAKDALLVAGTAGTDDGGTDVVAVDVTGRRVLLADKPPPGCAGCTLALREGRVRARQQIAAGDVSAQAGDELLVEEETDKGVRFLSLLGLEQGALVRIAGLVLENARPGYAQLGKAALVQADADPYQEVVLATRELRTQPQGGGQGGEVACTLEAHATLYDLGGAGLARIEALKMSATPEDAVINVVTALDEHGDHEAASRACAAQLSRDPHAATARLCLQRIRRLTEEGALVDAVNAAGLVAEASPSLRPVIAAPFHAAASALDRDARLFAGETDCVRSPLVDRLGERTLAESIRLATAKQRERVALADVVDAVFVTGVRDFGAASPVGTITARWLERVQLALPAKGAAIEALLLPQAPDPAPDLAPALTTDAGPGTGFGGGP